MVVEAKPYNIHAMTNIMGILKENILNLSVVIAAGGIIIIHGKAAEGLILMVIC